MIDVIDVIYVTDVIDVIPVIPVYPGPRIFSTNQDCDFQDKFCFDLQFLFSIQFFFQKTLGSKYEDHI